MRLSCLLVALGLLAACDRNPETPTAEENRQLDEAADLLNQAPANLEGVDDRALNDAAAANSAQ
jgi:uncharacterized lipoprotein YajG